MQTFWFSIEVLFPKRIYGQNGKGKLTALSIFSQCLVCSTSACIICTSRRDRVIFSISWKEPGWGRTYLVCREAIVLSEDLLDVRFGLWYDLQLLPLLCKVSTIGLLEIWNRELEIVGWVLGIICKFNILTSPIRPWTAHKPPVRIHVLSTPCDVISFNGQGQLCPLTCAEWRDLSNRTRMSTIQSRTLEKKAKNLVRLTWKSP